MKKAMVICMTLLGVFCLAGCAGNQAKEEEGKGQQAAQAETAVTYSNIADEETRALTEKLLKEAGVSEKKREVFFNHLDQMNQSAEKEWLTAGFEKAEPTETKYDPFEMQEQWERKNGTFMGYNCRITAFGLISDFINAAPATELNTEDLCFDLFALQEDPAAVSEEELAKFTALYAVAPTEETKDIAVHVKNLQKAWKDRGVAFAENEKMKLISVVLHTQFEEGDDHLLIGHAGILLPQEDGTLYFLEKVAFQEPYRINVFHDRGEVEAYLMAKYDVDENQPTAKPFIMENDEPMQSK